MAFAKLSGSLLESNDAQPARPPLQNGSEPSVAPASGEPIGEIIPNLIDVAHLYAELRDCMDANDQDAVRRVFNELVRARRPISEISGVVESLSQRHGREKLETNGFPLEESPPDPSARTSDGTPDPGVLAAPENDGALLGESP